MSDTQLITIACVIAGVLEIALGFPLFKGKVKPNGIYGFRTPTTLASEKVWYAANRLVGKDLVICGATLAVGSSLLYERAGSLSLVQIAGIELALAIVPLALMLWRASAYLKRL
ncbi:MAG TPA: SdpI family protein [Spirochaetota bacterium]|nr:SdpI family protein [Spirochaetota bacterium]HNT11808.1 SdpI family protein [Spirochaetota bacterium]